MEEKGYLLLVFHTHQPFILDPTVEYQLEENWLYESLTECYIPLLEMMQKLDSDNVDFKITFSFTPCLIDMLDNYLMQKRYLRYLDERIRLLVNETIRLGNQPQLHSLAHMYLEKLRRYRKLFSEKWNGNIVTEFKKLTASGKVEILASAATHAYLPLWEIYPQLVDLQVQIGSKQFEHYFGKKRTMGFWLPECGYFTNLDILLQKNGIKYFFLDKHGLLNGHPRPLFGEYAPIHCPSGAAAFGRDWESHDIVWLKDRGYPGDPYYLNYNRDLCFDLDTNYLASFLHSYPGEKTGIKYFSNVPTDGSEFYNPQMAFTRCDTHANDFISRCQNQVKHLSAQLGRRPVIVALFDTELFGHWWAEGPTWLDLVIRKMFYDQDTIRLISAADYLKIYPSNQVVIPSMSSWGYQGYSETWLMGRNHWIYPELFKSIEALDGLLEKFPMPDSTIRIALNQYIRELLLAQSSDWAFIMHTQTTQEYAKKRVKEHIENINTIYRQLNMNSIDVEWLNLIKKKNNIFSNLDLVALYRTAKERGAQ